MDYPFEARLISDLEKVFLTRELDASELSGPLYGLRGERVSFQIAVKSPVPTYLVPEIDSPLKPYITIRAVECVGCDRPADPQDPYIISAEPGLYPDPLMPLARDNVFCLGPRNWQSLWVTVALPKDAPAGRHPIAITLRTANAEVQTPWGLFPASPITVKTELEVLPHLLPPQTLWSCSWFYLDCLESYYHTDPSQERFWEILAHYLKDMADHGVNVAFTPLWTPELDTAIGQERPTIQLLGITEKNGIYSFDFSLLKRYIDLARTCGIERFEMAHAFSQWGAKATPKVLVNGERRFGWETPADSPQYQDFLDQLLPQLADFLRAEGLAGKCFFHNSDEPGERDREKYRDSLRRLQKHLPDNEFPIYDALSDPEFVRQGITYRPIPVNAHLENFADLPLKARWVYYCGNWDNGVPNRLLGMPSWRNRALGALLYATGCEGFLHWGQNFWFSQYSVQQQQFIPWLNTTAGHGFWGGDSFNVYPGHDGRPIDTLHYEVFAAALQDQRALQLHEQLAGRSATMALLQQGLPRPLKMTDYPHSAAWLQDVRRRLYQALKAL